MRSRTSILVAFAASAAIAAALTSCGGGGGGSPTAPSTGTGSPAATVFIRPGGRVEPVEVRIQRGQSVRFTNEDDRQHQPTSNPHTVHTDCPAANLPILSPGQSQVTGNFNEEKVCAYHDHLDADKETLRGVIRVGSAEGTGGPVYIRQ